MSYTRFTSASELCSYLGLTPIINQPQVGILALGALGGQFVKAVKEYLEDWDSNREI
jgi:pyruvate/2-oxoglutarate dehydrogenase complex dihydrolipoamide acyltransferase (E2) component